MDPVPVMSEFNSQRSQINQLCLICLHAARIKVSSYIISFDYQMYVANLTIILPNHEILNIEQSREAMQKEPEYPKMRMIAKYVELLCDF